MKSWSITKSLFVLLVKNNWANLSDESMTICVTGSGGTGWLKWEGFRLALVRCLVWAYTMTPTDLRFFFFLMIG